MKSHRDGRGLFCSVLSLLCELSVLAPPHAPHVPQPPGTACTASLSSGLCGSPQTQLGPPSSVSRRGALSQGVWPGSDTGSPQHEGQTVPECGLSPCLVGWTRAGWRISPGHRDRQWTVQTAGGLSIQAVTSGQAEVRPGSSMCSLLRGNNANSEP